MVYYNPLIASGGIQYNRTHALKGSFFFQIEMEPLLRYTLSNKKKKESWKSVLKCQSDRITLQKNIQS